MVALVVDLLNIFARSPGDLVFLLGVILVTQAGFFMALERRLRAPYDRGAERYTLAGIGITGVWALLMIGALVSLLSSQNSTAILPPLERAAQVVTILLVGWAFLTSSDVWGRLPNLVLLILLGLVCLGYIYTGLEWPNLVDSTDFNLSRFGVIWAVLPAVVSLSGILLVLAYFRRVTDAPLKLVYFALLLIGYGGTLIQSTQGMLLGHYAGLARMTFLAALLLLPVAIYRMVIAHLQDEGQQSTEPFQPVVQAPPVGSTGPLRSEMLNRERESAQLMKALGMILETASTDAIPQHIVRAALEIMRADVGMLLRVQDANYADILYAYDRMLERRVAAMSLNLENQPTLVNAIERKTQRPLFPDRNAEELNDLYTRLDVGSIGPAYFQPLTHQGRLVAVLMVGLPYERREFEEMERDRLKGISAIASGLLALSFEAAEAQQRAEERAIEAMIQGVPLDTIQDASVLAARQEMMASLELSRDQIGALNEQVRNLKLELDRERTRLSDLLGASEEGLSATQRMLAVREEQDALRGEREMLLQRLQEAETALAGATGTNDTEVYQTLVDVLQNEKNDLLLQKESLQTQLEELRQGKLPGPVQDVLAGMRSEKARMEAERDQLRDKLTEIEVQLNALGIATGPEGMAQVVRQLHDQRSDLQARFDNLKRERDVLVAERSNLEESIRQKDEREKQLENLQNELKHVAGDREAAVKQQQQLRTERDELLVKLDTVRENRGQLLVDLENYRTELEEAYASQADLRQALQQLADDQSNAHNRLERLTAENTTLQNEREQLYARIEGDRDRLQQLGHDGVGSLTSIIEELTDDRNQLERELNEVRTALAAAENRIEMLQLQMNTRPTSTAMPDDRDMVFSMLQQLRTPLTSIVGYVDLLLSESAGILGEMQHKFLQRVEANVNRLITTLDELTRMTALDTGQLMLIPKPIDVIALIEDAITRAGGHFREKGLAVHLNLEEELPWLAADEDALNQVVDQLLTNAYQVSPANSEVFITARRQATQLLQNSTQEVVDCLYVSVEDRGGGIAVDDQKRVFSRKYRAENPAIAGLGDAGVGLALAKALVEAHGGVLWLEAKEGVGSAFNFVLPIETTLEVES